ncbi:MAG: transposase [Deltaproteobacteria bacterium]|nr:transposase [Deltaproteobacteria bacterium]
MNLFLQPTPEFRTVKRSNVVDKNSADKNGTNRNSAEKNSADRKQRHLKKEWRYLDRRTHGGMTSNGRRKQRRPLATKKWIHVVLKSDRAVGSKSFLTAKNQVFLERLLKLKARKFGVAIADFANVGNHIHLKIRIADRMEFGKFLKSVTAQIARFVTGARRGHPFGRFWQGLAYTRVLSSRYEEVQLRGYIAANRLEASLPGSAGKAAREKWLAEFNRHIQRLRRIDFGTPVASGQRFEPG